MYEYLMWVAAFTVVLFLFELAMGRHRGIYRRADFAILIGSTIGRYTIAPLATVMIAGIYGFALPAYEGALADISFWTAFPILLLISEFCFYWVHRWAHENKGSTRFPVLWKLHRTHHSGGHMNVSLTYRVNNFWVFVVPVGWVLGMAIHLGQTQPAIAVTVTISFWNAITHCNFRWDDWIRRQPVIGRAFWAIEHVFVSPGIHHSHHGYGKDGASYRNYCTILSLWDWVFGTLHIPEGRPWKYGIPGPNAHWLEELFYPFVRISEKQKTD